MEKIHYVYILLKERQPVYIGVTNNLKNRISYHKKNKDIDSYLIWYISNSKNDCLRIERTLIAFASVFKGILNDNAKYKKYEHLLEYTKKI